MKVKKTELRSGQQVWTSGRGRKEMLPGRQTISVGGRKKHRGRRGLSLPIKVLLFLTLVTVLCVLGTWLITKPQAARPKMGSGEICVNLKGSELLIEWPQISGADVIRLYRVRSGQEDTLVGEYTGTSAVLTGVASGELVYLRLEAVKFSENMLGEAGESVAKTKTLRIIPVELEQPKLKKQVNLETQTVNVNWEAMVGDTYEVVQYNGDGSTDVMSRTETQAGSCPVNYEDSAQELEQGGAIDVAVRAIRKGDGYICVSDFSERVSVRHGDLMGLHMGLTWEQTGERMYTLHWQESKGDYFEIQQWSEKEQQWETLLISDWSEELSLETGRLPSCREMRYRAVAYEGDRSLKQVVADVEPSEIVFRTDTSPLYCTIWPIEELKLYSESTGDATLGSVPAGEALCVLGEENSRFYVRHDGVYGYIDERFCMINLPEYLGDLCEYEITNSYDSIFKVHGYDIPGITGTVVQGYESICLANDELVVPLLYPVAQRLETAAKTVREDGYGLRIYDAFRPNEATRYLYDTTEKLLGYHVSSGSWMAALQQENDGLSRYERAARSKQLKAEGALDWNSIVQGLGGLSLEQFYGGLTEEQRAVFDAGGYVEGMENISTQPTGETFLQVMTNGTYSLGGFLARSVSTHNRGIALDLTLVDLETDAPLFMQSDMHDLSWYSILSRNNSNAKLLAEYMLGAGFNSLSTEWWHFQDDETKGRIGLKSYLTEGVAITGWKRDDEGWRYQKEDGTFYEGVTVTVDGTSCTFNEKGYLQ